MNAPASHGHAASAYLGEEHELLRAQIRRFVDEEIKPHAAAWEQEGMVPREVLRRMGELGFFGIRYPAEYGGLGHSQPRPHGGARGTVGNTDVQGGHQP